ncbi:MAG TPA: hypothetical protein VIX37_24770, partial [Candidatus Sulfotelmatobacter sp.]
MTSQEPDCIAERGKGLPPLAPYPHPRVRSPPFASLWTRFLDDPEHFLHNQEASVASLRRVFG